MPVYFNNARCRDHVRHYGPGAFYDLDPIRHAGQAAGLAPGQVCIVATPDEPGGQIIEFGHFEFSGEKLMTALAGDPCRVFFGRCTNRERLSKSKAAKDPHYSVFFNRLGYFKRPSVIS